MCCVVWMCSECVHANWMARVVCEGSSQPVDTWYLFCNHRSNHGTLCHDLCAGCNTFVNIAACRKEGSKGEGNKIACNSLAFPKWVNIIHRISVGWFIYSTQCLTKDAKPLQSIMCSVYLPHNHAFMILWAQSAHRARCASAIACTSATQGL